MSILHISNPLIMHFGGSHNVSAASARIGDAKPGREIYRHSPRQGDSLQLPQNFQTDICSLGVVLLDLCLWADFIDHEDDTSKVSIDNSGAVELVLGDGVSGTE